VAFLGGILSLAEAEKKISKADYLLVCRGLESLVKSPEAAMLIDQQYEEPQKIRKLIEKKLMSEADSE
jgi:hypothetical protein